MKQDRIFVANIVPPHRQTTKSTFFAAPIRFCAICENSLDSPENSLDSSENSLNPFENSLDPFENSFAPVENSPGSFETASGSFENSLGIFEKSLAPCEKCLDSVEKSLASKRLEPRRLRVSCGLAVLLQTLHVGKVPFISAESPVADVFTRHTLGKLRRPHQNPRRQSIAQSPPFPADC